MMLSDLSVRRPVFAAVAAIMLCVIGLASYFALPVRELPSIDPPTVSIRTTYRGASAEIIEERISQVIERQVSGIQGVDRIFSSSRDGASQINVTFRLDRDLDEAANDVRDGVARVANQLPEEVDPPQISKADADAQPIIFLALSSPTMNRLQLADYANRYLVERLSTVPGVSNVNLFGAQLYSMRIWLDPDAMAARGVTVADVRTALNSQNLELPAGAIESQAKDFTIRVARGYSTPEEFAQMPIEIGGQAGQAAGSAALGGAAAGPGSNISTSVSSASTGQSYIVRLGDIARVEEGADERRRFFRSNGQSPIGMGVTRQSQANDLAISQAIHDTVDEINKTLPPGAKLEITLDTTAFTRHALEEVWITMGISMVLVALVNLLFLGSWRAALIPSIVAPICILSSFIVLAPLGFSINLLTLLALVLAIGLVVDDAIVVVENIQRRIDEGEPTLLAAERGSRQVFFAVVATTAVLIAVFAPLMFMPGYVGRLFVELAVAIAAAVGFSALLALSLSPMLASKLLKSAHTEGWLARKVNVAVGALTRSYNASLDMMIGRRSATIGAAGVVLLMTLAAIGLFKILPAELVPNEDRRQVGLNIQAPEGAGFDYTIKAAEQAEAKAAKLLEDGTLRRYLVTVPGFGNASINTGGGNLIMPDKGKLTAPELAARMNKEFSTITGARVIAAVRPSIQRPGGGGGGDSVDLILLGDEYPQIEAIAQPILAAAQANPGMTRVRLNYEPTSPRLMVNIDRERAAALGVPAQAVGSALQALFGSEQVTTYIKSGREYDVILQTDLQNRSKEEDLARVYVRTNSGSTVPLSSVVTTEVRGDTPNRIRLDRQRAIFVSAQLNPGYTVGDAVKFFQDEVAKMPNPPQHRWGGLARDYMEGSGAVGLAFVLALVLVFLVLAAQFESWIHPAVIMLTVPLAAVGGLFGLYLAGSTMNTYSQIGLIILVGVAAKNGILIVEFANQLRDEGRSIREAVIESATLRLRPIIMTSIAAAAGAVPLIFWGGAGGESRKTIGVTIFAGAIVATMVTLFVVPVFYNLLARFTKSPQTTARKIEAYEREEKLANDGAAS